MGSVTYRQVYLALKYFAYVLELPHNTSAWNALQDSLKLVRARKLSWVNDLWLVLIQLPIPVHFNITNDVAAETSMKL